MRRATKANLRADDSASPRSLACPVSTLQLHSPVHAPAQRARTPRAAGEAIKALCLAALTRRKPPATRLPSPGIYICSPPRLRPSAPTAACALSDRSIALSVVFLGAPWLSGRSASARTRQCAGRGVRPASKRTRSLAARSFPRRSAAADPRSAAVERISVSALVPYSLLLCAGRSDYVVGDFVAGQAVPGARRTAREARRERVRLCECARDGGAGQGSSQGLLCALCVAYVGHFGRGRSARAEAVTVVCGTPRAAAVVASAVTRRAFRSHDPGRPAGTDGRAGRSRVVV